MSEQLQRLRLAAVNLDGVLLNDTFSPVIHEFVVSRGGDYTAELESSLFSQRQAVAARTVIDALNLTTGLEDTVELYFEERRRYTDRHPVRVMEGAAELLERLRGIGLSVVCYGGLDASHFTSGLGGLARMFDAPGYVCTNDFRPGVHEITAEIFGLGYEEVLFVDDVARVAGTAQGLGVPFIGCPGDFEHGFQRQSMTDLGVRHLVGSLDEIDEELLRTLDAEAAAGTVWRTRDEVASA